MVLNETFNGELTYVCFITASIIDQCLSCSDVASPADCQTMVKCKPDEVTSYSLYYFLNSFLALLEHLTLLSVLSLRKIWIVSYVHVINVFCDVLYKLLLSRIHWWMSCSRQDMLILHEQLGSHPGFSVKNQCMWFMHS